ncbi:hypothetical protein HG530_006189 [Fusarium avenaceum]|nr:hypothetical protein HG530_006189 [Fusarium avenaceum]
MARTYTSNASMYLGGKKCSDDTARWSSTEESYMSDYQRTCCDESQIVGASGRTLNRVVHAPNHFSRVINKLFHLPYVLYRRIFHEECPDHTSNACVWTRSHTEQREVIDLVPHIIVLGQLDRSKASNLLGSYINSRIGEQRPDHVIPAVLAGHHQRRESLIVRRIDIDITILQYVQCKTRVADDMQ